MHVGQHEHSSLHKFLLIKYATWKIFATIMQGCTTWLYMLRLMNLPNDTILICKLATILLQPWKVVTVLLQPKPKEMPVSSSYLPEGYWLFHFDLEFSHSGWNKVTICDWEKWFQITHFPLVIFIIAMGYFIISHEIWCWNY